MLLNESGATKVRKININTKIKRIKKKISNKRTGTEHSYNGQSKFIIKLKI